MTSDDERAARDDDMAAFMALPRVTLYAGGLVALVLFVGCTTAAMTVGFDALGLWLPSLVTGSVSVLIAILRQSAVGRGALWSLAGNRSGGNRPPRFTQLGWVAATVLLVALPVVVRLAAY